ncbi:DJ-1/PfpI family protein [Actinoplanes couchii]|uniref:DJ-1/PfpI domain-containing protein n=1 Tax=Actinoplanes couchii TaxID=403638 RepID=A0ABQ3X505_9ACTN|nr:DJ-1/PfpI family protein [Actinoplanes couchii]MDR6326097.1 putative intracellular protease/amidase [Actinoplanes couchii]GID53549.1 hypothetical protein Aco03nite_019530 [Actinoplanes couchii]
MRRLVVLLLTLVVPAAMLGAGFTLTMNRSFPGSSTGSTGPLVGPFAGSGVSPAGRIPVAILLGSGGSVATDVLGPYDVLAGSPAFDVFTVGVGTAPVALSGGLRTVPDHSVDDLDSGRAPWPEIVVVPAFTDPAGDPELLTLIERVHDRSGLIFGVCAGTRVLTHTGILNGRRATSFWSDLDGLRRSHPGTTWISGQRWVRDGRILTTAGVSSGILGALQLVKELAGPSEEQRIGARINYPGWNSDSTTIPAQRITASDYPYPLHALLPWFQPRYGLVLPPRTEEIDIAAAAELYGGVAFTAHVIPLAEAGEITTAHGFRLLTTPISEAPQLDRLIIPGLRSGSGLPSLSGRSSPPELPHGPGLPSLSERSSPAELPSGSGLPSLSGLPSSAGLPFPAGLPSLAELPAGVPVFLPQAVEEPGDSGFDPILRDIARTDGRGVAATAAKYIEYPAPVLPSGAPFPWRITLLAAGLFLLTTAGWAVAQVVSRVRRSVVPQPFSDTNQQVPAESESHRGHTAR